MPLLGSRGAASTTGFGALANLGYFLRNSLRFRSSASAYLNRTFSTPTSSTKFTQSFWFKRGDMTSSQWIGVTTTGNGAIFGCYLDSSGTLNAYIYYTGSVWQGLLYTNQLFRDPAAWYHLIVAVDTTQATSSDRIKIYLNGSQITSFSSANYPNQNQSLILNSATSHIINQNQSANYFDGYLAEVYWIDGQQLTPSSFGKTDATTGQWVPKKFGGAYGTNGFYLPFTNTSSTSTLVADSSGNGNNWTPNNISLTAGVTYDSMTDVPTLTNATTANYATLNPIDKGSSINLSSGNLQYDASGTIVQFSRSTIGVTTGKWYFEVTAAAIDNGNAEWGIANQSASVTNYIGSDGNGWGFAPQTSGSSYKYSGGSAITYGTATGTGTYACAFDADAGKVWFSDKTGAWIDSGNPAAGTNESFSGLTGTLFAALGQYSGSSRTTQAQINFGQRPFAYTPPSGFKALNSFNLP
jgi:hypothetical protein